MPNPLRPQQYRITYPLTAAQVENIDTMFETLFRAIPRVTTSAATGGAFGVFGNGPRGFPGEDGDDNNGFMAFPFAEPLTLTGNVTGSGIGTIVTTIAAGVVTNAMLAGSIAASKLIGTDIATVGTLTAGATGAGFTVALSTSTITGTLADARLSANVLLLNAASNTFTGTTQYYTNVAATNFICIGSATRGVTFSGLPTTAAATGGAFYYYAGKSDFTALTSGDIAQWTNNDVLKMNLSYAGALTIVGAFAASNFSGTSSGTNTGDQTITLTGNVTGSGTGSIATTIAAGAVTNTMLAGSIAASKLVGTDIATVGTITTGKWSTSVAGNTSPFNCTATSTATGYLFGYFANTGAELNLGVEASPSASVMAGTLAYAGFLGTSSATALQLGANGTVRMTISSAGGVSIGDAVNPGPNTFHAYQQNNFSWNSKSINMVYGPVNTDGFVIVIAILSSLTDSYSIYTDSSNPPTTQRAGYTSVSASTTATTLMCPVKKGDYWEAVTVNFASGTPYWVPNGTNA